MINGVSKGVRFRRLGVFTDDGSVLALARNTGTREKTIFLIAADEETAYCRNGAHKQWQRLDRKNMETLLQSICQAVIQGLAVLKIEGNADTLINRKHLTRRNNMFTQMPRIVIAMVLPASMITTPIASGTVYASTVHGSRNEKNNIMPASRIDAGSVPGSQQENAVLLVAGGKAKTKLVIKGGENTKLVSRGDTERSFSRPDIAVTAAEETAGDLPDEARVRMYDEDGNFIGWKEVDIVRDDAGRIIKWTAVAFDKDGHRIGSSTRTFDYALDDKGRVASVSVTCKKDGQVVWTAEHTYTRDEDGKITERNATFKDAKGNVIRTAVQTYTRDENGRITESTIERKDSEGNLLSKDSIKLTYDEDGARTGRTLTRTNAQGKTIFESTRTFKDGILQKDIIKRFDKNGDLNRKEIINYH